MKENEITRDIINSSYRGRGLFYKYCHLVSCCEDCNKKFVFGAKLSEKLKVIKINCLRKFYVNGRDNNV